MSGPDGPAVPGKVLGPQSLWGAVLVGEQRGTSTSCCLGLLLGGNSSARGPEQAGWGFGELSHILGSGCPAPRAALSSTQGLSAVPLLLTAMLLFVTPWSQAAIHLARFPSRGGEGPQPAV